jgi:multiple sugar transport system substrate-binding protein
MRLRTKAMTDAIDRHPGRSGLAAGVIIGVALAALFNGYVWPLLVRDGLERGELLVMSGKDESPGGQRKALVEQWNLMHPRSPAKIIELSSLADDQRSEMLRNAQSGGQEVDIYNLDVTWMAEFRGEGYIRPLDDADLDTAGFLAKPLDTCRDEGGRLWGLPFNTDAGLLYYRTDLVGTPPDSRTALIDMAPQVLGRAPAAAPGRPAGPAPIALYTGQFADYEGLTVNAMEAIWAADGEVVDEDGRIVIDSAAAGRGLSWLASGNPRMVLSASSEGEYFHEEESAGAFRDGQVVFMRNWPVEYRALNPPASDTPASKVPFDVARLPWPSVLGGQNLAISSRSGQPRAAQALIEFLTSERSQQILFERGGFAASRRLVYDDQEVQRRYPYAMTLRQAIEAARPRPVLPRYAQFSEEFRRIVREALDNGGQIPPDAVKRLDDARNGYRR